MRLKARQIACVVSCACHAFYVVAVLRMVVSVVLVQEWRAVSGWGCFISCVISILAVSVQFAWCWFMGLGSTVVQVGRVLGAVIGTLVTADRYLQEVRVDRYLRISDTCLG